MIAPKPPSTRQDQAEQDGDGHRMRHIDVKRRKERLPSPHPPTEIGSTETSTVPWTTIAASHAVICTPSARAQKTKEAMVGDIRADSISETQDRNLWVRMHCENVRKSAIAGAPGSRASAARAKLRSRPRMRRPRGLRWMSGERPVNARALVSGDCAIAAPAMIVAATNRSATPLSITHADEGPLCRYAMHHRPARRGRCRRRRQPEPLAGKTPIRR